MAARTDLLRKGESPQQATFLELFFDLAFVFVIERIALRITEQLARPGIAEGWTTFPAVGRTLLLLMPLTWVWTLTAWTTARFDPRRLPVQAVVIMTMLGVLIMSAALPSAFHSGGPAFAIILHAHEHQRAFARELVRFTLTGILWLAGALAHDGTRVWLWTGAAALDYLAARFGWPVPRLGRLRVTVWAAAGGHLADRYRQLLLIALGESVLSLAAAYPRGLYNAESTTAFMICSPPPFCSGGSTSTEPGRSSPTPSPHPRTRPTSAA
ncbi:low temperature requirement protein A [Micromonospora sp. NPDC048830]|uniref:low temperature requirement protein A n=1 Tax=Micromonospora sp. NPDC048830 TaxID=3364257 RepID=UPI0037101F4A